MTRTLSIEETIQRPAPQVWAALTDWPNAPKWMPGIDGMAADGETAAGTTLTLPRAWRGSRQHDHPL